MTIKKTKWIGLVLLLFTVVLSGIFLPAFFPAHGHEPGNTSRPANNAAALRLPTQFAGALGGFGIALLVWPFRRPSAMRSRRPKLTTALQPSPWTAFVPLAVGLPDPGLAELVSLIWQREHLDLWMNRISIFEPLSSPVRRLGGFSERDTQLMKQAPGDCSHKHRGVLR